MLGLAALVGVLWYSSSHFGESKSQNSEATVDPVPQRPTGGNPPQAGVAPPGRGQIGSPAASDRIEVERAVSGPVEEGMNGEVVAWVIDSKGDPVDQWLLLSDDCGVRARIRQGTALTLSPPGECRFRAAPDLEGEAEDDDWSELEVIAGDTVYLELTVPDPDMGAADTGDDGTR